MREKFEKEIRVLDEWAAAGAGDGEVCGWLCGETGGNRMTLADIAYFPFLERVEASLQRFKVLGVVSVSCPRRPLPPVGVHPLLPVFSYENRELDTRHQASVDARITASIMSRL